MRCGSNVFFLALFLSADLFGMKIEHVVLPGFLALRLNDCNWPSRFRASRGCYNEVGGGRVYDESSEKPLDIDDKEAEWLEAHINDKRDGATPLHNLCRHGWGCRFYYLLAKLFLKHGAQVNVRDSQGNTPLMILVSRHPSHELKPLLLEHGAEIYAKNDAQKMALALEREYFDSDDYQRVPYPVSPLLEKVHEWNKWVFVVFDVMLREKGIAIPIEITKHILYGARLMNADQTTQKIALLGCSIRLKKPPPLPPPEVPPAKQWAVLSPEQIKAMASKLPLIITVAVCSIVSVWVVRLINRAEGRDEEHSQVVTAKKSDSKISSQKSTIHIVGPPKQDFFTEQARLYLGCSGMS